MGHTDDAYAAMLLTMALSPNKEEYARPLSTQEFRRFEAAARASRFRGIGKLLCGSSARTTSGSRSQKS